jgi:hypothetical protein
MESIITTIREDFKFVIGLIHGRVQFLLSLRFLSLRASCGERILENKAFSHAGAADVGGFTPNMG